MRQRPTLRGAAVGPTPRPVSAERRSNDRRSRLWRGPLSMAALIGAGFALAAAASSHPPPQGYIFNDSHFHLTNYIQEGIDVHRMLAIMGGRVGRVALFGIPLQQQWSYRVSGPLAPTYYLETDAPLYYYSFTDAVIASAYRSLPRDQRARFDPMITGFNPADMYAADHIRRVLRTFPGVFCGIGEVTVHKEFVSSKIAGETPSLRDPALDRILDLATEAGLVVLLHNDIDVPFPKPGAHAAYADPLRALFRRHPDVTIIWAHLGVGRVIHPIRYHVAFFETLFDDPGLRHVHVDISWDEVAKYMVGSGEALQMSADLINHHPDRFLFGTDALAPADRAQYFEIYDRYAPLWRALTPSARRKVLRENYERIFDQARSKVRAWENTHLAAAAAP
jgi:predicted TIM-barrel fold metal-dependent hydrolase